MDEREIMYVDDVAAWEEWLEAHHADSIGVRLAILKKSADPAAPPYGDYLDIALCFGWIDGRRTSLDESHFLQLFTPRTPRSMWSVRNRDHIARLTAAGAMRPAGLREVERAKADGRWEAAYPAASQAEVPPDLAEALAAHPPAAEFFAKLSGQNRFAVLYRIATVKRADTRARKIAQFAEMLARGETIYPQSDR